MLRNIEFTTAGNLNKNGLVSTGPCSLEHSYYSAMKPDAMGATVSNRPLLGHGQLEIGQIGMSPDKILYNRELIKGRF